MHTTVQHYSISQQHLGVFIMASDDLPGMLQQRLAAGQEPEPRLEAEHSPVRPKQQRPEPDPDASSSELTAKLTRRLDINEGNAAPRPMRVFNPCTEFKEFSRKQIKDMETMFKRYDPKCNLISTSIHTFSCRRDGD